MTPENVEKIIELVQLYGEARALRYHAQFGRPDMVPRLNAEELEALDDVRAALAAASGGGNHEWHLKHGIEIRRCGQ